MESPEETAPEESEAAEPAPAAKGSPQAMIERLYARRDRITTLIVMTIDDELRTAVNFSLPPNASGMSHLMRMMDVKLDRYYAQGMFDTSPPTGPVAGVRKSPVAAAVAANIPRNARRLLAKAAKKAEKQGQ